MKDLVCDGCGWPINPDTPGSMREVVGWVEKRSKGGVNNVFDPRPTGRHAHRGCLDEVIHPTQGESRRLL